MDVLFETVEEVEADNQQTIKRWRKLAADAKANGQPQPPVPYLFSLTKSGYKVFDPTNAKTTGSDAEQAIPIPKDNDYDAESIRGAVDTVAAHDKKSDFFAINDKLQAFYRGHDDWRVKKGDLTGADLARHRIINYYAPQRTQLEQTRGVKARGTTGDWIDPLEATIERVLSSFERVFRNRTTSAWMRSMWRAQMEAGAAGNEKGNLQRFMQIRSRDQARISELAQKGQLSDDTENLILTTVDQDTAAFMIEMGLEDAKGTKSTPIAGIARAVSPILKVELDKAGLPKGRNGALVVAAANGDSGPLIRSLMGKQIIYHVEDNQVYRSLSRDAVAWSTNASRLLSLPAGAVRKAATTLNPEFILKTVVRTPFESLIQSEARGNPVSFVTSTAKAHWDTWKAVQRGEVSPEMTQYMQSGAPGSSFFTENMNVLDIMSKGDLNKVLSRYGNGNPKFAWLRKGTSYMERLSDVTEQSNRVAEFNRVVQAELSKARVKDMTQVSEQQAREILTRAGRAAQEVNINFSRSGTIGSSINSAIPFFNAALQGTRRGVEMLMGGTALGSRSMAQRAKAATFVWSFLAIPALFQFLALDDDDEIKAEYDDIPDKQKAMFWFIPAGKDETGLQRFARLPKPPGILGTISTGYQELFAENPREWAAMGQDIMTDSSPSLVPTSFQMMIQIATGEKIEFGGTGGKGSLTSNFVPDRLTNVSPDLQDAPWTSELAYLVHEGLASVVGKDNAMSPAQFDNLLNSYTGGLGMMAADVPDAIATAAGYRDRASGEIINGYDVSNIPLIRLFMARDPAWSRRTITRFYDTVAATEPARAEIKALERRVEENRMTEEELRERIDADPDLKFAAGVNDALFDVRGDFGSARTAWERINNDTAKSIVERRIEMDELLERMLNAANTVVEKVDGKAIEKSVDFHAPRRRR